MEQSPPKYSREEDREFQFFLQSEANQDFLSKVSDFKDVNLNYGQHLSEEQYCLMLTTKAKAVLRADFEVQKQKAKARIALDQLLKERLAVEESKARWEAEKWESARAK